MWLVPHLRFPEFTGEWRYSSLGKECNILCGYPFDGQDMQESCGNVKLLRGINITEGEIRHSNELDRYYSGDTSRLGKYILKEGDLVIGMDGSKVGRNSAILTICEQGSYLVQRVCRIRSQKHNVEYIFQHINNSKFHRHVDSVKTASAIPHISQSDIQDYVVSFPPTAEEQIKITSLLSLLDARIATQNKIIERLQSLMSGIRHNVFTRLQNGNLYKLGEFLTEYSERNRGQELPSVAVGKYGIRKRTDIYSKELSKDYSNNKVIYKNTLTIGMGSSQIDIGILLGDEMYCVSPAYTTYRIHNINPTYLQEYLIHINSILSFKYMITSVRQGKSVNKSALLQHKIFVCNENEQNTIQYAFKIIKEKIAIEQNILKDLIGQKKYLLSKMFI